MAALCGTAVPVKRARWWARALALTAGSAFVGGTYHGFAPNLSAPWANVWWILTLLMLGATAAAMENSLLHERLPANRQKRWRRLIALKFGVFAATAIVHPVPFTDERTPRITQPYEGRYLYYKKAHHDGDLLPSFDHLSVWETQKVVEFKPGNAAVVCINGEKDDWSINFMWREEHAPG